jgi:hypothetical protein
MIIQLDLEGIKARLAYADAALERGDPCDVPVKLLVCDVLNLVAFVEQQVRAGERNIILRLEEDYDRLVI